jgi:phage baseplate assembly protein W
MLNTEKKRSAATEASFVGQGWRFPISFNVEDGSVELVSGTEDIEQSLVILLNTLPGERVTNLGFGCKAKEKIFDPIDGKFAFLAEEAIKDAVGYFEPRIAVEHVSLNYENRIDGKVTLVLSYVVRQTNSRHNLVHPFSLLEAEI